MFITRSHCGEVLLLHSVYSVTDYYVIAHKGHFRLAPALGGYHMLERLGVAYRMLQTYTPTTVHNMTTHDKNRGWMDNGVSPLTAHT